MDGNSIGPTHSVNVPTRIGDPPRRRGEDPTPEHRDRRPPQPAPKPAPSAGGELDTDDDTTPGSLDVFVRATNGTHPRRVAERRREPREATRGWGPGRIHSGRGGGLEQPPASNPDATEIRS